MLERIDVRKKRLETDGERLKEVLERLLLERPSLQEARPEQVTFTLTAQDAAILLNYCSIEDIMGKPSTQLKAPALMLNPNGEVIVQKMFENTAQAN